MAFITRVATPIVGLSLVIGASTVVRGEEGYDEVRLRCEGTYSERENPQLSGGHDFEMSIMTRHADGDEGILAIFSHVTQTLHIAKTVGDRLESFDGECRQTKFSDAQSM